MEKLKESVFVHDRAVVRKAARRNAIMKSMFEEFVGKVEQIDLAPLFREYEGKWVALTHFAPRYEVICSGDTAKAVYDEAIRKGHKVPALFKVHPGLINAIL
jgi:hypothetical protein